MVFKSAAVVKKYMRKITKDLDGNALICAYIEPLWAVFNGMIFFYMPLYMESQGLTVVQMGFINSFGAVLAAFTSFMAGPVTDRLGRKKTSLYFDVISWSIAMAIWAVSQNFFFFLAAAAFNAFSKVPSTSWTCLAIEDTAPEKRAVFFGLITIISLGSGIFTPVTGFMIARLGTSMAMRILLSIGFLSMTSMFLIRNRLVSETQIGLKLMEVHSTISIKEKFIDYKNAMTYMITRPITLITLIILLLTNFQIAFQFYLVVYLKDVLGLKASVTSVIPGISAFINLLIYFLYIPKLIRRKETVNLNFGLVLSVVGSFTFLFIYKGNYALLFISTLFTAAGNLIMTTFRDTLWNNVIGESERAKIYSAAQGLVSIIAIPSGIVAGLFYKLNPVFPFVTNLVIFIIAAVLSYAAMKLDNKKTVKAD